MPRRHRSHSMDHKRQVVAENNAGEALHGRSKRHDVCRNLIRVWIAKAEAGEFNDDVAAAELLAIYEAQTAACLRCSPAMVTAYPPSMWEGYRRQAFRVIVG